MKYLSYMAVSGLLAATVGFGATPAMAGSVVEAPAAAAVLTVDGNDIHLARSGKRLHRRHHRRRAHARHRHVKAKRHRRHRRHRVRVCTIVPGFDHYGRLVPVQRCFYKKRRHRR